MKVTVLVVVRIRTLEGQGGISAFNVGSWRGVMMSERMVGSDLGIDKSVMKQMVGVRGQERRGQRTGSINESCPSQGGLRLTRKCAVCML